MEENVRDARTFLKDDCTLDELVQGSVLHGKLLQLTNQSVALRVDGNSDPLRDLMRAKGITRLRDSRSEWSYAFNGQYCNPKNKKSPKSGNVQDLLNRGDIFIGQNTKEGINPYCINPRTGRRYNEGQEESGSSGSFPRKPKFDVEGDLQEALRYSIEQLEPGLRIVDGGKERRVEAGSIDITAEDDSGNLVIIELKDGVARNGDLTQLKSYMSSKDFQGKLTRGILVAHGFSNQVAIASREDPDVCLKEYSFRLDSIQFTFEDR